MERRNTSIKVKEGPGLLYQSHSWRISSAEFPVQGCFNYAIGYKIKRLFVFVCNLQIMPAKCSDSAALYPAVEAGRASRRQQPFLSLKQRSTQVIRGKVERAKLMAMFQPGLKMLLSEKGYLLVQGGVPY